MYCTNCGAEVSENQKYCNMCGMPIDPGVINVDSIPTQPGPVTGFEEQPQYQAQSQYQTQAQPQYQAQSGAQPKKLKTWPIIAIGVAGLLTVSVLGGYLFVKVKDAILSPGPKHFHFGTDDDRFGFDYDFNYDFDYDSDYDFDYYLDDNFDLSKFQQFEEFYQDSDGNSYFENYSYNEYTFATAYSYDESMYLQGNQVISDRTIIYDGKTIGSFCDYIDSEVLGNSEKIDRKLLYSLMEVHLVDDSFYKGAGGSDYFEKAMLYCLLFTKEFSDRNIVLEGCSYYHDEPTTYYYDVQVDGEYDNWLVDYSNDEVYFDYGSTEYHSSGDFSMFEETSKKAWIFVIDNYFDIK